MLECSRPWDVDRFSGHWVLRGGRRQTLHASHEGGSPTVVPPFSVLCPGRPDENCRENRSLIKKVDWKRAWKKVIFGRPNGDNMGVKWSQNTLER